VVALGTGLLRPFLLLYGMTVLRLSAPVTGIAMTAGVVAGLVCMPAVGRWLDQGARSTVVAASMLVRVLGVAVLLATPAGHVWQFATAALFLGIGNQAWPAAHAALVVTLAHGRERDTALAAGRALRNAALGVGALIVTASLAGGTTALRALAAITGLAYLAAAAMAFSVHLRASPATVPATVTAETSPDNNNSRPLHDRRDHLRGHRHRTRHPPRPGPPTGPNPRPLRTLHGFRSRRLSHGHHGPRAARPGRPVGHSRHRHADLRHGLAYVLGTANPSMNSG
jgi:MFS family permease